MCRRITRVLKLCGKHVDLGTVSNLANAVCTSAIGDVSHITGQQHPKDVKEKSADQENGGHLKVRATAACTEGNMILGNMLKQGRNLIAPQQPRGHRTMEMMLCDSRVCAALIRSRCVASSKL
eukprot:3020910-Amphidinium_carterae.1